MTTTAPALPPARRLPAAAWGHVLLAEARMVVRDTSGLVVPIGMPTLLLLVNGLGDAGRQRLPGGATVMDAIVMPLTVTMVVALVGVVNMPSFLAAYRKHGILRGLAVTPARPSTILVAQMVVSLAQVIVGVTLMTAVGVAFLGVGLPQRAWWALAVGALTVLAMYGVGTSVAAVAPTVNAALALGLVAFFVMLALGGGFGPVAQLPDALATVGAAMPYGAGNAALAQAWTGEVPDVRHLAVLAVWAVVSGGLAARLFRWT